MAAILDCLHDIVIRQLGIELLVLVDILLIFQFVLVRDAGNRLFVLGLQLSKLCIIFSLSFAAFSIAASTDFAVIQAVIILLQIVFCFLDQGIDLGAVVLFNLFGCGEL